jgi:hypothetical protein
MGKTRAAAALVLLAVGHAAIRADDPFVRRVSRQPAAPGTEMLPAPQPVPGGPTLPAPDFAPAPAADAHAPGSYPVPAAPAAPGDCAGCAPAEASHQHFTCIRHLWAWATYCPLKKGVNCDVCKHGGTGDCCRYHCFPQLYLFFMEPCADGHLPSPHCPGCTGYGQAASMASGTPPPAYATRESGGTGPETTDGSTQSKANTPAREHTSFFGTARMFSVSSSFGCGSAGSH